MKRDQIQHYNCGIEDAAKLVASSEYDTPRERVNLENLARRIRARKVSIARARTGGRRKP